jgi:hypothetical protein
MDPKPEYTQFRLLEPLPATVNGGRTRWVISKRYYGKNHARCCISARCIETNEQIEIMDGKSGIEEKFRDFGVQVQCGTLLHRIFSRLFHERRADVIPEGKTILDAYLFTPPATSRPRASAAAVQAGRMQRRAPSGGGG